MLADDVTTGHSTLSWRPVTGGQLLRVECPVLTSSASIAVCSDQGHVAYGIRPPCSYTDIRISGIGEPWSRNSNAVSDTVNGLRPNYWYSVSTFLFKRLNSDTQAHFHNFHCRACHLISSCSHGMSGSRELPILHRPRQLVTFDN